jgi:hypothetical protein
MLWQDHRHPTGDAGTLQQHYDGTIAPPTGKE